MTKKNKIGKRELVRIIANSTGFSQKKARTALNAFFSMIKEDIIANKKSSIPQIGSFVVKERKARKYKNIRTGDIQYSQHRQSVIFRSSSLLKDILNNHKAVEGSMLIKSQPSRGKNKYYIEDGTNCKVFVSRPNPEQTEDLRIKYIPIRSLVNEESYPIVLMPQTNSLLKLPREGRSDVRGYKEKDFLNELQRADLPISISIDKHLSILGRTLPYEPDFVLFDRDLNLYIDIEIDEPYD
jgi:nucleoid DNA-binding protein